MFAGIIVTAFSPLGNGKSYSKLGFQDVSCLQDIKVIKLAEKYNVTPAQVRVHTLNIEYDNSSIKVK